VADPAAQSATSNSSTVTRWRAYTLGVVAAAAVLTAGLVLYQWRSLGLSAWPEWTDFGRHLMLFLSPYAALGLATFLLSTRKAAAMLLLVASALIGLWGLIILSLALFDPNDLVRLVLPFSVLVPQWIGAVAAAAGALLAAGLELAAAHRDTVTRDRSP
jgi:hypothetical protein